MPGEGPKRAAKVATWVRAVMDGAGCSEEEARAALHVERRRLYLRASDLETPKKRAAKT